MTECASALGVGGRLPERSALLKRHDSFRFAAGSVALLVLYYAAGRLGLTLAFLYPSASPIWPASGLALAALLVLGPQAWPGVFLGAFLVNILTASKVAAALAIAGGNTLEAVVAAWLVGRYAGADLWQNARLHLGLGGDSRRGVPF